MKTCTVDNCGKLHLAKGYCRQHYRIYIKPEYGAWYNMKQRCYNSNVKFYEHYGGRGIKVCERWLNSYANFLEDMGQRPNKEYSLDRINNDGNYEPSNCRWATKLEQMHNQRMRKTNKSGVIGVYKVRGRSWRAKMHGHYLGEYTSFERAVKARDDFLSNPIA